MEFVTSYLTNMNWISFFLYNTVIVVICVGFYYLLKNKSEKAKYYSILALLIFGIFVHFSKLLIPEYQQKFPDSILEVTLSSPCAISALAFPFIYISKNKALKDYMVVFGFLSGVATLLFPIDALGKATFDVDVIRFYTAHLIILLTPLFTYIFKIHVPTKKWVKHTLLSLLLVCLIIMLNNEIFNIVVLKQYSPEFLSLKDAFMNIFK